MIYEMDDMLNTKVFFLKYNILDIILVDLSISWSHEADPVPGSPKWKGSTKTDKHNFLIFNNYTK